LVPETISFSIVAGVGPSVGLFTSFVFTLTISLVGGRPGMVSAAAGSVALVVAPLVHQHGVNYLPPTVILAGIIQIMFARCGAAKLMRFVPHSVMTGFVNALAILIFCAQLPHVIAVPWPVYPMVAGGLIILTLLPKVTTLIPAPIIATAILTAIAVVFPIDVPRVGDEGDLTSALPTLSIPHIPISLATLQTIFPYAIAVAIVGLLESLITARLVDELTETTSDKTRESWGQGVCNVVVGLFSGMGGCAMIGQTMMNVKACGGRTRISTLVAGMSLLCLVHFFGSTLAAIPMAALVAVMVMVSVTTVDWRSISPSTLRRVPAGESLAMLSTIAVTVSTQDLAYGVLAGVACAMIVFVRRVASGAAIEPQRDISRSAGEDGDRTYRVTGHLFFASSNRLADGFDYSGDPSRVTIDLSAAHVWDATAVAVLDAIREKYRKIGKTVTLIGLNESSAALHSRLTGAFQASVD
jgi:SulP family sulfate permease